MDPGSTGGGPNLGSNPSTGVQPTYLTRRCCNWFHRGLTFQHNQGFSTPATSLFHWAAASKILCKGILKFCQSPVPFFGSIAFCAIVDIRCCCCSVPSHS